MDFISLTVIAEDGVDDPCYQEGFAVYLETEVHGPGKLAMAVDLYTSEENVCGCLGDVCSLIPPDEAAHFPCYQGSKKDAINCYKTDPLLTDGTTWSCMNCTMNGFPYFIGSDPLYKSMDLWGVGK